MNTPKLQAVDLHTLDLHTLDREITEWGEQGFMDLAMIVHDDNDLRPGQTPIFNPEDPIPQMVANVEVRGPDMFVYTKSGEIFHYRMTVERV